MALESCKIFMRGELDYVHETFNSHDQETSSKPRPITCMQKQTDQTNGNNQREVRYFID